MEVAWPPDHLENLVSAINSNECVVFLGAGPSADADYPMFPDLCSILAEKCTRGGVYRAEICNEAAALAQAEDPLLLEWLHTKERGRWLQTLQDLFPERTPGDRHSAVHKLLLQLPFVGYITTNYDMCMEDAASLRRQTLGIRLPEVFAYPNIDLRVCGAGSAEFIYHIHGSAQNVDDIVLTPSQYRRAYSSISGLPDLLERVFSTYVVLFVGFSLSDLEIVRIVEDLGHAYRDGRQWAGAKDRYALLSKQVPDDCTSIREESYFHSMKTNAIYYPQHPTQNTNQYGRPIVDHRELTTLLTQLQAPFREHPYES